MGPEKCPFCGQEIDSESIKCFFCGSVLDESSIEKRLEQLHEHENTKHISRVKCPLSVKVIVIIILICTALFTGISKLKPLSSTADLTKGTTIQLNANVTFSGSRFIIHNNDSFDWINVELQIISDYILNNFNTTIPKIPSGKTYSVSATEFTRNDGTHFNPYAMEIQRFWIKCNTSTKEKGSYFAGLKK
jgi:hypothetical protein